jgi:hypothetical protein
MPAIRIDSENVLNYPAGTVVVFNYGAMHGTEEGVIVDFGSDKWGVHLIAKMPNGSIKTVTSLNTEDMKNQVGAYIPAPVAVVTKNPKSPWYKEH